MKMKKLMALVLALTLVLALAACGQPSTPAEGGDTTAPAEGEQTLIVYTARSESLNNAVIENFEADTGIHVEVVTGGTGEVLKRVRSEAANPQAISAGRRTKPCSRITPTALKSMSPPKTPT